MLIRKGGGKQSVFRRMVESFNAIASGFGHKGWLVVAFSYAIGALGIVNGTE